MLNVSVRPRPADVAVVSALAAIAGETSSDEMLVEQIVAGRRTEGAELDEKIEATIADPANDPEVALQEKDRGELLRRALIRLSPQHRQVIDLVYYHEKSVDEVAHILDVPPATVKTRMFYARKKLAELVNGAEKVRC